MSRQSELSCQPCFAAPGEEREAEAPMPSSRVAMPAPARSDCLTEEWLRQEIETLGRYLEGVAGLLGREPVVRGRYGTALGNIRHVERVLVQIAPLINAADKAEAVERITDPALKARLKRKPVVPPFESKH